jgi:hypothetical protein
MMINSYQCEGGKRTMDIHHGGRVIFSFYYWPWLLHRRWKIELWHGRSGGHYLDIGPVEFVLPGR